jgi:predicted house-cleaning noncanonical NTP pyrophosphatase (MazG superfamily)
MRKEYNKLVRDRIPEIIRESGRKYAVEVMPDEEYRVALLDKLLEEAQEAVGAGLPGLIRELADLYEVIDAVMAAYDIEKETVLAEKGERLKERGGFAKRLRLLWTD